MTLYGVRRRLKLTSAERGMLGSGSEANDHPVSSPSGNPPQGRPPRPALRLGYVAPGKGPLLNLVLANGGGRNSTLCHGSQGSTYIAPNTRKKPRNPDRTSVDDSATSTGYSVDLRLDEECKSCTSCHIDLSSRTLPQRKQHIRRCNQPPPGYDNSYKCDICSNIFGTYAGLRQHTKRSHPVDYNTNEIAIQDNRSQSSKPKWTASEERQLARLELSLPTGLLQKDIIAQLSELHTGRSAEGIKKQRQKSSYKEIMTELRNDTTTGASPSRHLGSNTNEAHTSPQVSCHKNGSSLSISNDNTILDSASIASMDTPSTPPLLAHQNIYTFIKELSASCSEPIQALVKSLDNNSFEQFDRLFSTTLTSLSQSSGNHKLIRKKPTSDNKKRRRNKRRKHKNPESRSSGRAATFSSNQRLFQRNTTQLAHAILDNKEINVTEFPNIAHIEGTFRPLFEELPRYANPPPQTLEDTMQLDYPITFREMQVALRHMKQSACGPDGLKREDLKLANGTDLVCLLNIVFGLCCTPTILRRNRTVLIPKKGDLTKVNNWRPITITSIVTRLLHKILALRKYKIIPCTERVYQMRRCHVKLHHTRHDYS